MAYGDNPVVPLREPGERPTAAVTAAVTGGRFVKISGNYQGGPLLDLSTPTSPLTGGNLPQIAQCVAGDKAYGVSGHDGPTAGDVIPVLQGPGMVVPMTAGAAITAGQEVQSDANGNPIPLAAGKSNGMAESGAGNGATVYVRLYA
jgi:hypothetical protein